MTDLGSPQMAGPRFIVLPDGFGTHGVYDHERDEFIGSGGSYDEAGQLRNSCNGQLVAAGRGNILEGRRVFPQDHWPPRRAGVPREGDFVLMPLESDAPQGRSGWFCTQVTRVTVRQEHGAGAELFQLTTVAHGPRCWSWRREHLLVG